MKLFAIVSTNFALIIAFNLTLTAPLSFAQEVDIVKAKETFKKCGLCHALQSNEQDSRLVKKLGPHLQNLAGRQAGTVSNYKYSASLKRAGDEGLNWNKKTLSSFLKSPKKLVSGTKMSFVGLKSKEERGNLIAWLFSTPKLFNNTVTTVLLGASALKIKPDIEYGQYLSGECVTCHQANETSGRIPSIIGLPKEIFIHAVYEYKTEVRKSSIMRTVAKRLSDEELVSLAAYFASLPLNADP